MLFLDSELGYFLMFLIPLLAGAVGGFAAELLLHDAAGHIEKPRDLKRVWDAGFAANVIVGALAGVAVLLLYAPVDVIITAATDTADAVTKSAYELRRLIPLALIVGTAGGAVLAALQSKVLATFNAAKVKGIASLAKEKVAEITLASTASGTAANVEDKAVKELARAAIRDLDVAANAQPGD